MKKKCIVYSLATKYIVIIIGASLLAFLISFQLYSQGKYTYATIFFVVSIIFIVTSTYQKRIDPQYSTKQLNVYKTFFGFCFSKLSICIDDQSKFKLYKESSLGHEGGASTRHLILSVTGHLENEFNIYDINIVSEHIENKKGIFIDKAKVIADRMKLIIQNES